MRGLAPARVSEQNLLRLGQVVRSIKTKILGNDVKTLFQFQFGFHKIFNFVPKIASKTY